MTRRSNLEFLDSIPWGAVRLVSVVGGGLLVLQSSAELDASKVIYLLLVVASVGVAVNRLVGTLSLRSLRPWYGLFIASAMLLLLVVASFLVARNNSVPPIDWFRDAVTYGLFAFTPLLAWDAGTSTSSRVIVWLLILLGALATLSWAIEWLDRRHIADLPFERFVLPAGRLSTALYVFAIAAAVYWPTKFWRWAMLGGAILGIFLATGSRSSLLLLIVPLIVFFLARELSVRHRIVAIGAHLVVASITFGLVIAAASATEIPDAGPGTPGVTSGTGTRGAERIGSVGSLIDDAASDPSVRERVAQYKAAADLFASSPLTGVGLGHPIPWTDVSGRGRSASTADTPLVLPAKLGILGVIVVAVVAYAYVRYTARIVARIGWTAPTIAATSYGALLLLGIPLGMALEDKSLSFALIFIVAIVTAGYREHREGPA